MALNHGNLLILDEPTNHIDLPTKEVLEEALKEFGGTMILVSHDRYLLNKTASRIVELTPNHVRSFDGDFDFYINTITEEEKSAAERQAEEKRAAAAEEYNEKKQKQYRSKQQRADDAKRRQLMRDLENEIEQIEEQIAELEEEIASPEIAADFAIMTEKCSQLEALRSQADEKMEQWATLDA